jgi:hypothetical protein
MNLDGVSRVCGLWIVLCARLRPCTIYTVLFRVQKSHPRPSLSSSERGALSLLVSRLAGGGKKKATFSSPLRLQERNTTQLRKGKFFEDASN